MLNTDYKYVQVVPEEYNHCLKRAVSELYQADSSESLIKFNNEIEEVIEKMKEEFLKLNSSNHSGEKIRVNLKFKISLENEDKK